MKVDIEAKICLHAENLFANLFLKIKRKIVATYNVTIRDREYKIEKDEGNV